MAIIILNYNNLTDTIGTIESIEKTGKKYDIYLVDNNSTDGSGIDLKNIYETKYRFIETNHNLGYAAGNNVGLREAYKDGYDFFCIINNDIEIENDTIDLLQEYLKNNPQSGLAGPAIMDYFNRNIIQSTGGIIDLKKGKVDIINCNIEYSKVKNIYFPAYIGGACIMCTREYLEKIGYIPEAYFLFFEETEWCLKGRRNGFNIACYTPSKIYHKGSASISKVGGLSDYLMERNRMRFVCRNGKFTDIAYFCLFSFFKSIKNAVTKDIKYLFHIKYYYQGLTKKVDDKYPFIYINECK